MLCLPQWALAWSETDETVNLTAKRGEAIHNEWTEMIYETEPYIESGSVYVQIEKEDLGMIAGFQSYKITEFQCYDEGTAVIKVSNAVFDGEGHHEGYVNYTFNVTVSADPYVAPTNISDSDPWADGYDWDYTPDMSALHDITVEEGSTTNNWIKLMMIASSYYDDMEHKFMRQWQDVPSENISITSGNTSAVTVLNGQFIAQSGAAGQTATITISCAPDITNDWVPSASYQFVINVVAPVPSTPSGPSFTWSQQQVNLVSLACDNYNKEQEMALINNIFASLTQTRDKNEDWSDPGYESCQFYAGSIRVNNCGNLKFKSITGDLTGIIITCSDVFTATGLSAGWTYDASAGTLTWLGTAAEEVTLSGNIECNVSTIEFFYSPAAAPRLGESFYDAWQWYEITGAHTAKVTAPRNMSGGINIPASVEDGGVTYYITAIDPHAFDGYPQLSAASIGENVASIGAQAFDGCTWMTEITVNSTVLESVGNLAFRNCKLLQVIEFYTDLPPVLGSNIFYGDDRLNHIHVHSSYVSDYQNATGWSAYSDKIGALWSNPAIGEQFFWHNQTTTGLYQVTSVRTSTTNREAKVLPYSAAINAIYPITREGTLIIPEAADYIHYAYPITGIGADAYKNCTDIDVVMMPQAVKTIESGAFSGCTGVKNVFFLWNDLTDITWADANVGADFATAASGNTKIIVPTGKLAAYQAWAPAWAGCMLEGNILDVTATQDPENNMKYYRTFYDSSSDYMLPPSVWAYVGYVSGGDFILHPLAFDGGIIPAGTAVVLESETPTYRLISVTGSAAAYTGRNDLIGRDNDIAVSSLGSDADRVYVLGKEFWIGGNRQVGMGLYRYTGTTLAAHKAYMILDASGNPGSPIQTAPVRFLFKHEQMPTDVENIQENNEPCTKVIRDGQLIIIKNGKEYNAQGQIVK